MFYHTPTGAVLHHLIIVRKRSILLSDEKKRVGERLALVRGAQKMSQKDISDAVGVPWRTYQKYETGVREVSAEFLVNFATKFSIRPEWLLSGMGGMRALSGLDDLKSIIVLIEEMLIEKGQSITPLTKADIVARLLRKCLDGHHVEKSDVKDYVEITLTRD